MLKFKKIAILTLTATLLLSSNAVTFADEFDDKIQQQTEKISTLENDQKVAQATLNTLEQQIGEIEADVKQVFAEKTTEEEKLNKTNLEIADLKIAIEKRNNQLSEQARDVQLNQTSSNLLEIVLGSDSISEAFGRAIAVTTIVHANNEIIEKQKSDQDKLEELVIESEKRIKLIEEKSQLLKEKQEALVAARLDQEVAINELESMIATEKEQKELYEAQKIEAEKKREAELKAIAEQKAKEEAARQAQAEQQAKEAAQQANNQVTIQTQNKEDSSNITINHSEPASPTSPSTSSGWGLPVSNIFVSSTFGWRSNPWGTGAADLHDGIDLVGSSGTPIYASRAGTVVEVSYHSSAGNHVIIDHGDGYYSYYLHLSSFSVSVGQSVSQGTVVGGMGTTGNSTGVHLHFGVSTSLWSNFVDPAPLLGI